MLLLILLAILAIIALGVGFVAHWLFIVAAVLALIWLISLFTGGFGTGAPASEVDLVGALGLPQLLREAQGLLLRRDPFLGHVSLAARFPPR